MRSAIHWKPRPYDLIVEAGQRLYRVQAKTTNASDAKSGAYVVRIAQIPRRDRQQQAYDPADVDFFFIVAGSGDCYIVPLKEVGGTTNISLSTVKHRKVDTLPA